MISKVNGKSIDILQEKITRLRQIIPECFSEGMLDFEKLQKTIGKNLDKNNDKYSFNWSGRSDTFKNLQTPSTGTLLPKKNDSINFKDTKNIFIEGDNLEVLKLLQKSYFEQIKIIYIDPPYNTGKDFIYKDDFHNSIQVYLEQTGQIQGGIKLTTNPETSGRFHSNWISMMYSRLFLARNLLKDDGLIFVSIDDHEIHNLRMIMDEVFGEENFISTLIWKNKFGSGAKTKGFIGLHEYILCYAKDISLIENIEIPLSEKTKKLYKKKDEKYEIRGPYGTWPLETTSMDERSNLRFPILYKGIEIWPEKQWLWSQERVLEALKNNEIVITKKKQKYSVRFKQYLYDENGNLRRSKPLSIIEETYTQEGKSDLKDLFNEQVYTFPKPVNLIKQLIDIYINGEEVRDEIILDFFAGSGTTAHAVLDLNKSKNKNNTFICVQIPEPVNTNSNGIKIHYKDIAQICKERIKRIITKLETDKDNITKEKSDLGFKVFELARSNFKIWENLKEHDLKKLRDQMKLFQYPLIDGASELDVIYECIIKEGYDLNANIEKLSFNMSNIYKISDSKSSFFLSLDKVLNTEDIKNLNLNRNSVFFCIDGSLDDSNKVNLSKQFHLKTL